MIGALCYGLSVLLRGSSSLFEPVLAYLAGINIILGIFNLLPGFPLDGGRVLRSIIWSVTGNLYKATQIATVVGQVIAYLFIVFGIWIFFTGNAFNGLWFGFIGWFLLSSAQAVRMQATVENLLRGVTVEQLMSRNPLTVPANISLQKLVDEYILPQGLRSAFVLQGDRLAGLITLSDIRHMPREEWGQQPVGFVMIPADRLHSVTPLRSVGETLPLFSGQDVNQLPVLQDGVLVGVLTRDAIIRALHVRQSLGLDRNKRV